MAEKRKAPKGTVKKVLSFIGIYKFRILLSLICAAVSVGATLYIPLLFGNALELGVCNIPRTDSKTFKTEA